MPYNDTRDRVLYAIEELTRSTGIPPTHKEIAQAVGLRGPSGARYHVQKLEQEGLVETVKDAHRSIRLAEVPA